MHYQIKRPPEIQLFLTPQKSMGTSSVKERVQVIQSQCEHIYGEYSMYSIDFSDYNLSMGGGL